MIGHQAVSIDVHVIVGFPLDKVGDVVLVICGFDEDRVAIVSTLHDVMWITWNKYSWRSSHVALPAIRQFGAIQEAIFGDSKGTIESGNWAKSRQINPAPFPAAPFPAIMNSTSAGN